MTSLNILRCLVATLVLFCAAITEAQQRTAATNIGSRLELLVDDYLIDDFSGSAALTLHPPTPQGVVMVTDRPWEGNASHYRTIIKDGDRYRMYFSGLQYDVRDGTMTHGHERFLCYAESTDGVRWDRPDLGLVEFDGSTRNNIIADSQSVERVTIDPSRLVPFKDLSPDCPQDARYKAVVMGFDNTNRIDATTGKPQSKKRGLFALKSADGFHFKLMSDRPILTEGAFDSQNLAFFDPAAGVYREYHRGSRNGVRSILTGTSRDFLHWTESAWVEFPQAPPEHIYTNQVQPYFRAPHILVGFPLRYVDRGWIDSTGNLPDPDLRRARSNVNPRFGSAVTDGVFMSSRDGLNFKRWSEAFIRPGISRPGSWVYGDNSVAWGMIETKSQLAGAPDELSLYVTDGYWTGKSLNVRRYTLRIDGFVSVRATSDGGEILTKPLIFDGKNLVLNFSTSAAGSVKIELQRPSGNPIKGFTIDDCPEIFGDSLEQVVSWNETSDVSKLSGKPIRMRIIVKDADLYSFRFRR